MSAVLKKIVEQLEKCGYQTNDGLHKLEMNEAFIKLKSLSEQEEGDSVTMSRQVKIEKILKEIMASREKILKEIMASREKIIRAFIAETGLKPSECESVERRNADGTISWHVRKREN